MYREITTKSTNDTKGVEKELSCDSCLSWFFSSRMAQKLHAAGTIC